MVFDSLRASLRSTFRRKSKRNYAKTTTVDGKKLLACKVALLDGTDVSINLQVNFPIFLFVHRKVSQELFPMFGIILCESFILFNLDLKNFSSYQVTARKAFRFLLVQPNLKAFHGLTTTSKKILSQVFTVKLRSK